MTDLHTHILPGIDDGARTCEISRRLLAELKEEGVNKVVFTPHFYWRSNTISHFLESRAAAFARLQEAGVPEEMEFHLGAEAEFNEMHINPAALSPLAIDNGKYILLELPFSVDWQKDLFDNLTNFINVTGMTPIIAHAERYPAAQKKPAYIAELLDMGCLIQVNSHAIVRAEAGSLVTALFDHGQVQCLGSDCHNLTSRRPHYAAAVNVLRERYGADFVSGLQETMERILRQEKVRPVRPHPIKKTLLGKYK